MPARTPPVKNAPGGNPAAPAPNAPVPDVPAPRDLACARYAAVQGLKRLGGWWKTPVLVALLDGPRRFAALERALAPVSAKVLAQRLRELERDGLVTRTELVRTAPKVVEYRLTPLGEASRPVFDALAAWARGTAA